MTRFQSIADYYDVLFPANSAQIEFLEKSLAANSPRRWVDIACGPGQQLEALTDRSHEVWGLDLERSMIERCALRRPDLAGRLSVGNMQDAGEVVLPILPGLAGVVYCIGNSLVQLTTLGAVEDTLRSCCSLLAPDGTLVVQVVNFDRVLSGDLQLLPKIEKELPTGEMCTLEREYQRSREKGCVKFYTRISTPAEVLEHATDMFALTREHLVNALNEVGFSRQSWFGGYQEASWTPEAPATIVRASRPVA